MSKLLDDGTFLIEHEPDGICKLCGRTAETRPYGPNGEDVCYDCGMKDRTAALRQLDKRLDVAKRVVLSPEVLLEQVVESLRN